MQNNKKQNIIKNNHIDKNNDISVTKKQTEFIVSILMKLQLSIL